MNGNVYQTEKHNFGTIEFKGKTYKLLKITESNNGFERKHEYELVDYEAGEVVNMTYVRDLE